MTRGPSRPPPPAPAPAPATQGPTFDPALAGLVWPAHQALAALHVLAGAAGLAPAPADALAGTAGPVPGPAHLLAGTAGPAPASTRVPGTRQIEHAAQLLELEVEAVELPWSDLRRALTAAAPALLWLPGPGAGCLALLRSHRRHRRLQAVAPDGSWRHLDSASLARHLRQPAEETLDREVAGLLASLPLAAARRKRARRALTASRLDASPGLRAHLLGRSAAARPLVAQLLATRLPRYGLMLILTLAGQEAMAVAGWVLLGRGLLAGHLEAAWLDLWALLLLALPLGRGLELAAAANLAEHAGLAWRRKLFAALPGLHPEAVRGEGTGRLLGRLLAADQLESQLFGGGPGALAANGAAGSDGAGDCAGAGGSTGAGASGSAGLGGAIAAAAIEMAGAVVALGHGAAPLAHLAGLAGAAAGAGLLLTFRQRAHGARAEHRMALTERLVEELAGHRTRLADATPAAGRQKDDGDLVRLHALGRRRDGWDAALGTVLPRGWTLYGLAALAPLLLYGSPAPGRMAASLGGLLLAQGALNHLGAAGRDLAAAAVAARQLRQLWGRSSAVEPLGAASAPSRVPEAPRLLEARHLAYRPRGSPRPILAGACLELRAGDRVLLEGASGAGKSTLAALLCGERAPDSGLLLLDGLDLATLGARAWRQRVVAVPPLHANHLFAETLAFNLLLGRSWPPRRRDLEEAEALCRELGLDALLDRLPAGLEQRIGEGGWQLSNGEESCVCLARALLQDPDLLILDESLGALDPTTRRRALAVVVRRARTLVLIAHPEPD